jgi:hypothetical protein
VVVKEATVEAARDRLRREARVLRRTANPGVVELLDEQDEGERTLVVTRFAGPRTMLDLPSMPADQVAALGAGLAQVLADLHRCGISHGNLIAEHVLVTNSGAPVLCGLGDAGLAGPLAGVTVDAVTAGKVATALADPGFDPSGDAAALALLLRSVLLTPAGRRRAGGQLVDLLDAAPSLPMVDLAEALARLAGPRRAPLVTTAAADPEGDRVGAAPGSHFVGGLPAGSHFDGGPSAGSHVAGGLPAGSHHTAGSGRAAGTVFAGGADSGEGDGYAVDDLTFDGFGGPDAGGVAADGPLADWFFSDELLDGPTRDFGPRPNPVGRLTPDGVTPWHRRPLLLVGGGVLALVSERSPCS